MSDFDGPYLFDVGVIALAHTTAPVRDAALSYVQAAITGDIDAIVPYPAVLGAHTVLTTYYGHSNDDASRLLQNFMDAKRINWYDEMPEAVVRGGLSQTKRQNGYALRCTHDHTDWYVRRHPCGREFGDAA
jgi:hypothetical protein